MSDQHSITTSAPSKSLLTAEYARECLDYNPDTGILTWKRRPLWHFKNLRGYGTWNAQHAGKETGSISRYGYIHISINKRNYWAHRIIWLIINGEFPIEEIDHINHNRTDNRITNLKNSSRKENSKNHSRSKANTSGQTGVSQCKRDNIWKTYTSINGKVKHLGNFNDFTIACAVVIQAQQDAGYHPNHGKS